MFAKNNKRLNQQQEKTVTTIVEQPSKKKKRNAEENKNLILTNKRQRSKTKRFGKRSSTVNHNDFFTNFFEKSKSIGDKSTGNGGSIINLSAGSLKLNESESIKNEDNLISVFTDDSNSNHIAIPKEESYILTEVNTNQIITIEDICKVEAMLSKFFKNVETMIESRFSILEAKINSKFESMQKHVARVEAKINLSRTSMPSDSDSDTQICEQSYLSELKTLGCPFTKIEDLDSFEKKLNDASYEQALVKKNFA